MDLQQLRAFREVARTGSFSHAAERLFLTQPAISHRIAQLEEKLDTRLLDRIGRRFQLTEAGLALLDHADSILGSVADAERAIHRLSGEVTGTLKLATSHHIGLHRLPPVLREFNGRYPGARLDIMFTDSEIGLEQVRTGAVEMAIITLPPTTDASLLLTPVWADPLSFFCATTHPLASRQRLKLADLVEYDALLPSENTFTRRIASELFQAEGLPLQVSMSTNYMETLKVMAAVGLGWTLLPDSMQDDSLHRLPIRGVRLTRQLGCVIHRDRTQSNAAQQFGALLLQAQDAA